MNFNTIKRNYDRKLWSKAIKNQNQPACTHHSLMYIENLKLAFRRHTAQK